MKLIFVSAGERPHLRHVAAAGPVERWVLTTPREADIHVAIGGAEAATIPVGAEKYFLQFLPYVSNGFPMKAAHLLRSLLFFCAASLSGCEPTMPMDGFEESLTRTGGCGDLVLFAVDEDDEIMLRLDIAGLLPASTEPTTTEHVLPEEGLELVVEVGERVSDVTCDDAVENGGPQVERFYTATAGTAWITTRAGDGADPDIAYADLLLGDVVLESEKDGEILVIESFAITDALVGWLAG